MSQLYQRLQGDSLRAAKVADGLQTTAVYWEIQSNPNNGFFGFPT